jgi:hypothetical protein
VEGAQLARPLVDGHAFAEINTCLRRRRCFLAGESIAVRALDPATSGEIPATDGQRPSIIRTPCGRREALRNKFNWSFT